MQTTAMVTAVGYNPIVGEGYAELYWCDNDGVFTHRTKCFDETEQYESLKLYATAGTMYNRYTKVVVVAKGITEAVTKQEAAERVWHYANNMLAQAIEIGAEATRLKWHTEVEYLEGKKWNV